MSYSKALIRFLKRIKALFSFLLDPKVNTLKKVLVIGMLVYVFSPLDLLPDPILGFGFIDDAFIAIYVINKLSDELDKYITSEQVSDINVKKDMIIEDVDYKVEDE